MKKISAYIISIFVITSSSVLFSCSHNKQSTGYYVAVIDYDVEALSDKDILKGCVEPARINPEKDYYFSDKGNLLAIRSGRGSRASCTGIVTTCFDGSPVTIKTIRNNFIRTYTICIHGSCVDLGIKDASYNQKIIKQIQLDSCPLLMNTPVGVGDPSEHLFVIVRER